MNADNMFAKLVRYSWDGKFFSVITMDALSSRMWRDALAVDEVDLQNGGALEARRVRKIKNICKGISCLPYALPIDDRSDVVFWRHRTFGERFYVANLLALPAERLKSWRGWTLVHADAICR